MPSSARALVLLSCSLGSARADLSLLQGLVGPLEDSSCTIESVEQANDRQLHDVIKELAGTLFFRLINVNMETKCQYFGVKEEDEEPECTGGKSEPEEPGVEAVPLCSLGASEDSDPFGASAFGGMPPPVAPSVDHTITTTEDAALSSFQAQEEDCSNEELPTFWMDMCSNIATNASDYVNLQLNPERYTGYNGSHVWGAIYQENCLSRLGGHDTGMCYEERVLYRLLSGMHAATNTHIARYYHAPSKRKNRTESAARWAPDLPYFKRQFQNAPERLRNMHFAFVVLLRAVRRASPYLSSYSYSSGDAREDARTTQLVGRLLDSHILESCSGVFEAFDETLLFREKSSPPWWSLKKQFKGVFHNISRVIDCVTCQKCKLHAKVTMLGMGTALKALLLPPELLPAATTRDEVVALFNTLEKFSAALVYYKELTALDYQVYDQSAAAAAATAAAEGAVPDLLSAAATPLPAGVRAVAAQPAPAAARTASVATAPTATPAPGAPAAAVPAAAAAPAAAPAELVGLMDGALGVVAALAAQGALSAAQEEAAVARVLAGDAPTLLLCKHFGARPNVARLLALALAQPAGATLAAGAGAAAPVASSVLTPAAAAAAAGAAGAAGGVAVAGLGDGPDAVVVGGGVAGMTATLQLLDAGARVTLLDKEGKVGGNSAKASSGINGGGAGEKSCCPPHSRSERNTNDTVAAFAADTAKSALRDTGFAHTAGMIELLASRSEGAAAAQRRGPRRASEGAPRRRLAAERLGALAWPPERRPRASPASAGPGEPVVGRPPPATPWRAPPHRNPRHRGRAGAIAWLKSRTTVDLSKVAQLGGHAYSRTHRPANGMIGAELVFALQRELKKFEKAGQLTLRTNARVTRLLQDEAAAGGGRVVGLAYVDAAGAEHALHAPDVVLATGGFANDRTDTSLLAKHRPDLVQFPTTNGVWATGDGMKMAMAIGADTVDMDRVQIHPTGFVDPSDLDAPTKTLCGEMMRGVGGILLTPLGNRFVNELSPRDKVVQAQQATGHIEFGLVLNAAAAAEAGKHAELYLRKGLLSKVAGVRGVAEHLAGMRGAADADSLEPAVAAALEQYNAAAAGTAADPYGKVHFHNTPLEADDTFLVGRIVPVLHYCMGGIRMDATGAVLRDDNSTIAGLHAAGEVTGGVHGNNRLGGNSLLECTVFGSIVGEKLAAAFEQRRAAAQALPAATAAAAVAAAAPAVAGSAAAAAPTPARRVVSQDELAGSVEEDKVWVSLYGTVYDLSDFADEHPAGPESITKLAGTDGTAAFEDVHNEAMLSEFESDVVGKLGD